MKFLEANSSVNMYSELKSPSNPVNTPNNPNRYFNMKFTKSSEHS